LHIPIAVAANKVGNIYKVAV
jgi:hypothetical protein